MAPMLRPDLFGLLATHAGDAAFEVGYRSELSRLSVYAGADGSYPAMLDRLRKGDERPTREDLELLEVYCYAAAYSADSDGTVHLPFDDLGVPVPEVGSDGSPGIPS